MPKTAALSSLSSARLSDDSKHKAARVTADGPCIMAALTVLLRASWGVEDLLADTLQRSTFVQDGLKELRAQRLVADSTWRAACLRGEWEVSVRALSNVCKVRINRDAR